MLSKEKIQDIISEAVSEKNAFIVEMKISTSNKINIEIDSIDGFTINDCVEISRLVEDSIDRDEEDFELDDLDLGDDEDED